MGRRLTDSPACESEEQGETEEEQEREQEQEQEQRGTAEGEISTGQVYWGAKK